MIYYYSDFVFTGVVYIKVVKCFLFSLNDDPQMTSGHILILSAGPFKNIYYSKRVMP